MSSDDDLTGEDLRQSLRDCRAEVDALRQKLSETDGGEEASLAAALPLLNAVPAHIAVLGASGNILAVNRAWEAFASAQGGEPRGSIGANYLAVCREARETSEVAAAAYEGIQAVLKSTRESASLTYACPTPGATYWFEMQAIALPSGGALVSHFDVSEAMYIREKLERNRLMLERTERIAKVGGWQLNLQTGDHVWSDQTFRLHDLDPAIHPQPTASEALLYYPPEARAQLTAASKRAIEDQTDFEVQVPLTTATGRQIWVRTHGEVVMEEGEAVRIRGIMQDLTKRYKAQQALKQKEALLRSINSNLSEGVYRSRPETGLEYVNQAFVEMFGYDSAEEIMATDSAELYADLDMRDKLLKRERETNALSKVDIKLRRKDGSTFWGRISSTVIRKEDGGIDFFVGAIIDITEQKQFERQLIEAKEQAEKMNRLKSAFLANMSHEIRTPLTAIIGFAEVLEEQRPDDKTELPGLIRKSGKRLMDTLNSVLDLAQLESDSFEPSLQRHDVRISAAQAVQLFSETAAERGLELHLQVPDESCWVRIDPSALDRVLANLITNACKFTREGHVEVRVMQTDELVRLQVEDTGIGIPEQAHGLIFEEFEQVSSGLARHFEGTGLGLAISRQLVELMEGRIDVESVPGEGSTFTVELPRDPTAPASPVRTEGAGAKGKD